ncbi:unnamed protein product [Sphenostylis stenocarpa]|uniref:Uncharacterized protein n=1 Tax=Sphenostylis stenocarpa TaxID=92480 RepID=A0AA86S4L4_9FABA|nr:unnamed protein product [Sphenostylis stenocarpa]
MARDGPLRSDATIISDEKKVGTEMRSIAYFVPVHTTNPIHYSSREYPLDHNYTKAKVYSIQIH